MADEYNVVFDRDNVLATHHKSHHCQHIIKTVCLCAAFCALGLCIAIPGPTLIDLRDNTHTNSSRIASIFTGRSAGHLVGCVVSGILFDHINQSLLLTLTLLLMSAVIAAIPFTHTLAVLIILILCQGVMSGFLDTGGNVSLLRCWGKDSAPYLQAIHFSFGLGAFVAPLIAETFLMEHVGKITRVTDANETLINGVNLTHVNSTLISSTDVNKLPFIMYSYFVVAVLLFLVGICFLLVWCRIDGCVRKSSVIESAVRSEYIVRQDRLCFRLQMLLLLFVFYFIYVGMEMTYGALIVEFAVEELHWDRPAATWLNSLYWGSFAVARAVAIPLVRWVSPGTLLTTDLVLTTVALTGLVAGNSLAADIKLHGQSVYGYVVWICTAMFGAGVATIFPAGISWAERYIHITGKATSVLVVGSSLGGMVLPAVCGYLLASSDAMWLMYIELVAAVANVVLYVIMCNLTCNVGERYQRLSVGDDTQPLQASRDDDDDDDDVNEGVSNASSHNSSKKHVTFDLVSASCQTKLSAASATSSKTSILKSKSSVKKD